MIRKLPKNGDIGRTGANVLMGTFLLFNHAYMGHEWIVNTTASYHVTSNLELFSTYKAGDFGMLEMYNTSYSKISGMKDICIEANLGYQMTLKNVRHVSDLRHTILLSACALDPWTYWYSVW